MQSEYSILGYRNDLYFYDYKLAIEDDKLGHKDRNINWETEREKEKAIEKELSCGFISNNPDEEKFNVFKFINKLQRHVEKLSKKSLIDKTSKRLMRLEFKWNHSTK